MTVLAVWSPTNIWPANGPNLPPLLSHVTPLADWPIFLYGNRIAGGSYCGIFFASAANRLPLCGCCGAGPMAPAASAYHLNPPGCPTNLPGIRCLSAQVPFHGP